LVEVTLPLHIQTLYASGQICKNLSGTCKPGQRSSTNSDQQISTFSERYKFED